MKAALLLPKRWSTLRAFLCAWLLVAGVSNALAQSAPDPIWPYVDSKTSTTLTIGWTADTGDPPTYFYVYYRTINADYTYGDWSSAQYVGGSGRSYMIQNATPSEAFEVQVDAGNDYGYTQCGWNATGSTLPVPPHLTATLLPSNEVHMTWTSDNADTVNFI